MLHGALSAVMQDEEGQIVEAHSISAGLDYPGTGPQHAHLRDSGRARYEAVTDTQALAAFREVSRLEGIIPALGDCPCAGLDTCPERTASWTSCACPGAATRISPRCSRASEGRFAGAAAIGAGHPAGRRLARVSATATAGIDRIAQAFAASGKRAALMPYLMGGYPDARGVGADRGGVRSGPAPTCSSWASPTPTRSPTAR